MFFSGHARSIASVSNTRSKSRSLIRRSTARSSSSPPCCTAMHRRWISKAPDSHSRARNVVQIANELGRYSDALAEATTERQRFKLLKHASPELLAVLTSSAGEHVARFRDYRNFRIPLRGTDLEVPVGPHIAKALERTREAVFMGEITLDEARSFAQRMAIKYLNREQVSDIK